MWYCYAKVQPISCFEWLEKLEKFSVIAKGDSGLAQQQEKMVSRVSQANLWQDPRGLAWAGVAGDFHGGGGQIIQGAGYPAALGNSIIPSLNSLLFHSSSLAFLSPPVHFSSFSSFHFSIPFCLTFTKALILFLVLGLHTWRLLTPLHPVFLKNNSPTPYPSK